MAGSLCTLQAVETTGNSRRSPAPCYQFLTKILNTERPGGVQSHGTPPGRSAYSVNALHSIKWIWSPMQTWGTASSATKLTVHKLSGRHVCHSLPQRGASRALQITTFPRDSACPNAPMLLSENQFCRIFTRYDKRDASFSAFLLIASITILLKEHRLPSF